MSKKLILILVLAFFFTFNNFALANLIINEIMYDPPGADANAEWIKVQNIATIPIDLSTWYVADYDTSWHFHKITGENGTILDVGAEALIVNTSQVNFADFKIKMSNYNGLLFRASFTLGNDKGRLGMSSDKKSILSDTSYVATPPVKLTVPVPVKIKKNSAITQPPKSPLTGGRELFPSPDKGRSGGVEATVINSVPISESTSSHFPIIILVILLVFIGASAYGVYFIRRKKVVSEVGSDFEILDE